MNLFAISSLTCVVFCFFLAVIAAIYGRTKAHRILFCFNIAVTIWGVGCFVVGLSEEKALAVFGWKLAHVGGVIVSTLFFHLVCVFCNVRRPVLLFFAYSQALFFTYINLVENKLITHVRSVFGLIYNDANFWFSCAVGAYLFLVLWSFGELVRYLPKSEGNRNIQARYILISFLFGFLGGTSTFMPEFGIDLFYPVGNFGIPIYSVILSYAILKYRLLDISVAITRTGVFVAVYSLVLGIPFALAFGGKDFLQAFFDENWWVVPLLTSTVLASLGPYIYGFVQKRAEENLLQEQRQYQSTLRQASLGMGRIKNLKKLLNLIVHIVTRSVRIEHCQIYLLHEESGKFILKASKGGRPTPDTPSTLSSTEPLVKYFYRNIESIVYDEIKQKAQDFRDTELREIVETAKQLNAALIVPSFIENKLLALFVLGRKKSGKLYSHDDLAVFSILANQSALAIENAQFFENMQETHKQLFKAEKMATLGTMADGLSHQINNRLHAMGFIAGDMLDTLNLKKNDFADKELMDELAKGLAKIRDNVKRGGEIVGGLLKYTRKGEEGMSPVDLNALLDASVEMAQFKIKLHHIDIHRNFNHATPKIKGNFTQLQEVFFNIIDNAYDAMMQRKEDLKEQGYKGRLDIYADKKGKKVEIRIEDNGIGVKKENLEKMFTPFFTTKLSSKKGTGLGMYVIRQIVEQNHEGAVEFTSEYKKGSTTKILLPVMAEEEG